MASTYSTNLGLELIATGEQSGTWGATTNANFGTLTEQAIVGYGTQAVTDSGSATVLTIANGASSTGRNYVITLTGALTAARTVEVPAVNKPYIFFNSTTGGFAVTVKVTGQTGVVIANGKKAIVYTNTTDVIEVANAPATEAGTQTLTNKTLTAPVIATIVNTGTLTLPTSTDTLVGRATTDTLTNKTLTSPLIGTVIGGTSASSSLTLQSTSGVGTSDSILFKVGNNGATTAMTVNTSGNVGIGTASPGYKFDVVKGSVGDVARFTNGVDASLIVGAPTGGITYNQLNGGYQSWQIASSEKMRIDSSGNVGIGTVSPGYVLDVNKNSATNSIRIGSYQDTSKQWLLDNTNGGFTINGSGATSSTFMVNVSGSEAMRIDSSGNVGIGTSSPSTYGRCVSVAVSDYQAAFSAVSTGSAANWARMDWKNQNIATTTYIYKDQAGLAGFYNEGAYPLTFGTTNTERMRIDSSGNVGIGATANASAILDAQSTTKGVRFPNMTTTQKNAVSSPAAGLVVFDTTLAKLCVYSGSAWQTITSV